MRPVATLLAAAAVVAACAGAGHDASDVEPDVQPDAGLDAGVADAGSGTDVATDAGARFEVLLGYESAGGFAELTDGTELEVVQGSQGGIHVEVLVHIRPAAGGEETRFWALTGETKLSGEVVASLNVPYYPIVPEGGLFASEPLPIIFFQDEAEFYLGPALTPTPVVVCLAVGEGGGEAVVDVCRAVVLVDRHRPPPE